MYLKGIQKYVKDLLACVYHGMPVVMGATMAPAIFKPEKNLVFFQDKIAGAIDDRPVSLSD